MNGISFEQMQETETRRCECGQEYAGLVAFPDHPGQCSSCQKRETDERLRIEYLENREQRARAELPEFYRWATFAALDALPVEERRRRVKDPTGIDQAKGAKGATRVILQGPAGAGKSVLACCLLRAWCERGPIGQFVNGFQVAVARAQAGLGAEAPLVARAMQADKLVLDDLLAKPGTTLHDATSDIIHARHEANRRTIITSGFSAEEIKNRLGDGIARRVFEDATIIRLVPQKNT